MATIDKAEIKQAQASVLALGANLERKVPNEVENEVNKLINAIEEKIVEKGLVGDPSDKPGQPPLVASFRKNQSGNNEWTIYSTAEHAMALEEGASPHTIEPDNANLLAFVPDDPSKYPQKSNVMTSDGYALTDSWYDPEKGMVFATKVDHPGNKEYNYISEAQARWYPIAHININSAVKNSIRQAGFKDEELSLGRDPDFIGGRF